jgi:hypothetical protein
LRKPQMRYCAGKLRMEQATLRRRQSAYPYNGWVAINAGGGRHEFECELLDTGVFDQPLLRDRSDRPRNALVATVTTEQLLIGGTTGFFDSIVVRDGPRDDVGSGGEIFTGLDDKNTTRFSCCRENLSQIAT